MTEYCTPNKLHSHRFSIVCLLLVLVFLTGLPFAASAETPSSRRVILIETMPVPAVLSVKKALVRALNEMAFEAGIKPELDMIKANGDPVRARRMLKKHVKQKRPDLVISLATMATQAAKEVLEESRIPLLFAIVSDPVGAGVVKRIGVPSGTNVTGRVYTVDRKTKIELVMSLVGQTTKRRPIRFGFIHSTYPSSKGDIRELMLIADDRPDVEFVPEAVRYREVPAGMPEMLKEVKARLKKIEDQVDFWWEPAGPMGEVGEYTQVLIENSSLPVAMGTKLQSVKLGAILHVTPNWKANGKEMAAIAISILKGKDPGTIPVIPPMEFDLGLNITTCIEHDIVVPHRILKLAGENVYR